LAAGALLVYLAALADREVIAPFYDPVGRAFPLRDTWAFDVVGHQGLKWVMAAFWVFCVVWRPLRRGALYMAVIAAVVVTLKHYSPYSCPWDLFEYGGTKPDTGRCLPAGHPLVGFSLFGLYLALRNRAGVATVALAAALAIGFVAGAVQVARGAHFPSHVLWTAWVAWAVTLVLAALAPAVARWRA
jgi:membrane-associated PAP2 superfamily phosphatase